MSEANMERFFNKLKELLKKDVNGKVYVDEDQFNYTFVSQKERNLGKQILEQYGLDFRRDVTTKQDRSPLVRDMDYGKYKSVDIENHDVPVMAKIEWDENGNIVYENYDALDQFLESEFLPNNIELKKKRKDEDSEGKLYPFVQLNKITKLKLSDIEVEHVMNYLEKEGINVRGIDSTIDQEFENYDYYRTYRSQVLPDTLDKNEITRLFKLYSLTKDPVVREQIINANLRLVPWIAYKYGIVYGLDSKLLESYGYEGLIYSVERFDYKNGYSFSSYAVPCIRGYIRRGVQEIMTSYGQRGNWSNNFIRDKRIVEEISGTTLRENPALAEEITKLMIEDESILYRDYNENITRINLLMAESLDELLEKDQNIDDEDYASEENDEFDAPSIPQSMIDNSLESIVDNSFIKGAIEELLSILTPREEKVIRMRYGLDDGRSRLLEEIAAILRVSRERVRQIEAKAIRKLRNPGRLRSLKTFLENPDNHNSISSVGPASITASIDLNKKIR